MGLRQSRRLGPDRRKGHLEVKYSGTDGVTLEAMSQGLRTY